MFGWLKELFGFGSSMEEVGLERMVYDEIERLKKENSKMKEELDWYHYLGLPNHKLQEEGFDYYNFLKRKIEELEADKQYLISSNIKASKKIQQMESIEKLYLEEIARLQQKLNSVFASLNKDTAMQQNAPRRAFTKDERSSFNENKVNERAEKEVVEEEIMEEIQRPLKKAKKTIKGLRSNLSTYA